MMNYLRLTRIDEWILTSVFVLMGVFMTKIIETTTLFLLFLAFFFMGASLFGMNECFDARYDRKRTYKMNVISENLIKKTTATIFSFGLGFLSLIISYLFLPITVFFLFAIIFIISVSYSVPPFRLKERGISFFIQALSPPLLVLIGYMAYLPFSLTIVPFTFLVFMNYIVVGIMQEIRDYEIDKESGFKTFVIHLDIEKSVGLIKFFIIISLILYSILAYLLLPVYFLLLTLAAIPLYKIIKKEYKTTDDIFNIMSKETNRMAILFIILFFIISILWFGVI